VNVGIVGNRRYADLRAILGRMIEEAPALAVRLYVEADLAALAPGATAADLAVEPLDALLSLGGDGTLLRGARLACRRGVPILGLNMGHVGFLASAGSHSGTDALARLARGGYTIDPRLALEARLGDAEPFVAVNDVVVHKGGIARVIRLSVMVDGEAVGPYSADGIIVSTPTGSTAYSMSAGGPIVVPSVDALVITAICPHTLAVRPLVVPSTARITICPLEPLPGPDTDLVVSIDGQVAAHVAPRQELRVTRAPNPVLLARIGEESYFSRLSLKLQWGDLSDRKG
jgi:NAD+ kinase